MPNTGGTRLEELRGRLRRIGRQPDPFSYVFAGASLVSLGAPLLAASLGLLSVSRALTVAVALLGVVLIIDAYIRYQKPWTRYKSKPYAVVGACLLSAALSLGAGLVYWWAAPVVVAGLALLIEGLLSLKGRRD